MYTLDEQAVIWLTLYDFITPKKGREILELFEEPGLLLENFLDKELEIGEIVGEDNLKKMKKYYSQNLLPDYLKNLEKLEVKCLTYLSEDYPEPLLFLDGAPLCLFCKGDISLLKTRCIAIVGSRATSNYGKIITAQFARALAENGFTIVSGLALGVDKISHESALDCGGKTIAVLGSGFNYLYPADNAMLAKRIAEKGLLISEYRPSVKAALFTFPQRNRIIAGLSLGVLITEAGEKSGSLITKEYALEYGKDIFAVPGNINSPRSAGTNRLIKSCQGACVTSPDDILEFYGIEKQKKKKTRQLSINEQLIFDALQAGELTLDEIQEKTKLDIKTLNSCLTTMQISALIRKLPGNEYTLQ